MNKTTETKQHMALYEGFEVLTAVVIKTELFSPR
jgi:hypothetical protein